MKNLKLVLALTLGVAGLSSGANAQSSPAQTISLKKTLEVAASQSPEVKAAELTAQAATETHKSDWRKIYLPKVGAGLGYSHLFQDQGLSIPPVATPLGALNLPALTLQRDTVFGTIGLIQPIFDPETMLYKSDASEKIAEAEKLKSARQVKETQAKAASYYLQILELRAKRSALERFVKNLKSRQPEIKRLYELGRTSESDSLKVKLGIDDAMQGIRELSQKEEYLGQILASLLGQDQPLSPDELNDELPDVVLSENSGDSAKREDIQSLDKQLEAVKSAKSASKAAYLPKVSAFASHVYLNSDSLARKDSDSAGVLLTWSLFDGGAGISESAANAEKSQALEQKRRLAFSSIQATYQDAVKTLKIKKIEYEERNSAVQEARKIVNIEFSRLKSGKSTVNNLIDAEDVLKDRQEKAAASKVGWYQAWFNGLLASGEEIRVP